MEPLPSDLVQRLSSAVERMPAFPKGVQRILELTRDINCQPRDIVAVIEKDPVIAVKILKIINSAYYNVGNKISSINQSVVYLGVNTVKNLALNFSVVGMLPEQNAAGFDTRHYLMHSRLTANLCEKLGTTFAEDEFAPNDGYIAGLLHNFGKVVFAQFMPEQFLAATTRAAENHTPLFDAERQIIGADHALAGAMLVQHWQFPELLVDCIRDHHSDGHGSPLGECLYAADLIAETLGFDVCINRAEGAELPELPERFGGDMEYVIERLGGERKLTKLVDEARMFAETGA
jgi:HD-like signal output (HDOD) protein